MPGTVSIDPTEIRFVNARIGVSHDESFNLADDICRRRVFCLGRQSHIRARQIYRARAEWARLPEIRGYEDWSVVAVSQIDNGLKVIVANPIAMEAYRAGIPGNGKPFPDGSKIAKITWKPKKNTQSPFA